MKTKVILFAVLTLAIGFVLGMLTSAQLRYTKLKPVRLYFSEDRLREGLYKTFEPDEKQKAEIKKTLDKYININRELQENFWKELDSNMKELRKELDSKLTKEQLLRLKEMDDRRQEMIKEGWRNRNNFLDSRNRWSRDSQPPWDPQRRQNVPSGNNGMMPPPPPPLHPGSKDSTSSR
jgi:hypothetical protein